MSLAAQISLHLVATETSEFYEHILLQFFTHQNISESPSKTIYQSAGIFKMKSVSLNTYSLICIIPA
jgi:hypothetical protein